MLLKCFSVSL